MIVNFTNPWGPVNENAWQKNDLVAIMVINCSVLLVTFFVGITANLFVTYAVYHQKSLQTSTNALLVNLAVIDLLRCATDCPLLLIIVLNKNYVRDLGQLICDGQVMSFSLSCCVQLFTLASISAERHQAIANPFKTAERQKRVKVWIPLTWAVAIVVSVVCVMFTKDSSVYVQCRALNWDELKTYDTFGRYVLLPVWSLCLALIVGFYSHIFILVKAHNRKIFDKGISAPLYKNVSEGKKKRQQLVETTVSTVTEPAPQKKIKDDHSIQEVNRTAHGTKPCNIDPEDQKTLQTVAQSQPISMDNKTLDVITEAPLEHPNQESVMLVPELHHNTTELIDLENTDENGDHLKNAEKPNTEKVPPAESNQKTAALVSELHNQTPELEDVMNCNENPGDPPKDDKKQNSKQVPADAAKQQITTLVSVQSDQTTELADLKKNIENPDEPPKDDKKTKVPPATTNQHITTLVSAQNNNTSEEADLKNGHENPGDPPDDDEKPNLEQVPPATTNLHITTLVSVQTVQTTELADLKNCNENPGEPPKDEKPNSEQVPPVAEGTQTASADQATEVMGEVCMMPSFVNKERLNKKKEGKLAKRSGYIIVTYVVFWMPLIWTVLLKTFLNRNQILGEVEILVVSMSCMTSLTNPIIYAVVNPQFRTEFDSLKARWKALCTKS